MKKYLILAAFAAAALSSCMKETDSFQNAPQTQTVYFNAGAASTKAYFDDPTGNTYPVLWSDQDTDVALSVNLGAIQQIPTEISTDHKTAKFSYDTPSATSYQFVVVNPFYALRSVNKTDQKIRVEIPAGQECSNTSPDRMAIVMSGLSAPVTKLPDMVDIEMGHIPAYLHLTISNVDLQGATVQSVNIVSAKKLAGRFYQKADKSLEADNDVMFGTVGVKTSSLDDVWAGVFPADLSNETIGIQVVTNQGTFSKGIQFGAGHAMESGKIYKIAVDMTGVPLVPPIEYLKVTDVSQLHSGDKVIVVAETSDTALSNVQNDNNRSGTGVSRTSDGTKILNPSSVVEILSLEDGHKPGQWALKATSTVNPGYLYAADTDNSKNLLRTKDVLDASASWNIAINDDANKTAHITADMVNRHNLMRFNEASNLFSCYGASTSMLKVNLYRKDEAGADWFRVTMPTYSANIAGTAATFPVYVFGNIEWEANVSGGASLDVSSGTGPAILTLTVPENTNADNSRDITVTVTTTASVTTKEYEFTMTQAAQPQTAVFPIVWSMPAISATWQSGVDYYLVPKSFSGSYIYSDTHQGKVTVYSTANGGGSTNPNYRAFGDDNITPSVSSDEMCFIHYAMGYHSYWQFEVFNVKNAAGTYNIQYKMCSSNAGPCYYRLEYTLDDDWSSPVPIQATQSAPDNYGSSTNVTYTYATIGNNAATTVNASFHLDAIDSYKTLKIRAYVVSKIRANGTSAISNNSGGTNRLFGTPTITFTAD